MGAVAYALSFDQALSCADAEPFLSTDELRQIARAFEDHNLAKPQVELEVIIHRSPGIHARELRIPAGIELSGAVHKYENLNILSGGTMDILTERGVERITAPFTCVSPPGTKRIARAVTDCVWTTILHTDEQDPDVVREKFTTNDEAGYLDFVRQQQLIGE